MLHNSALDTSRPWSCNFVALVRGARRAFIVAERVIEDVIQTDAALNSGGALADANAQGIQRQLFSEAIGTRLPITVLRNGAMVDVITVPTELVQT